MRREQKRLDKKNEKERSRKKESRRSRLRELRQRRAAPARKRASGGGEGGDRGPRRPPGRFAGILAVVAGLGITLLPLNSLSEERTTAMLLFFYAAYFLMFGYFVVQWMLRRGSSRAMATALVVGAALAVGVGVTVLTAPEGGAEDLIGLAVGVPALGLGAWLGRLVWTKATE